MNFIAQILSIEHMNMINCKKFINGFMATKSLCFFMIYMITCQPDANTNSHERMKQATNYNTTLSPHTIKIVCI